MPERPGWIPQSSCVCVHVYFKHIEQSLLVEIGTLASCRGVFPQQTTTYHDLLVLELQHDARASHLLPCTTGQRETQLYMISIHGNGWPGVVII